MLFFVLPVFIISFVFLGQASGVHFYLLAVSIALVLSTPLDRSWTKYLSTAIAVALFFTVEFVSLESFPIYHLSHGQNRFLYLSTIVLSCMGLAMISINVTSLLRHSHQSLREIATTDQLTGLYNRRYLFERFDAIDKALDNNQVTLLLMDVDHFKQINDSHGHDCGDEVLAQVSAKLQQITPDNAVVTRIGGEEFCILLPKVSCEQAQDFGELIRYEVESLRTFYDRKSVSRTLSVGIAQGNVEFPMSVALSLFQAKKAGRNCVVPFRHEWQRRSA